MDPVAFGALKGPDLVIFEGSESHLSEIHFQRSQSNPSKMDPIGFGALKGQEKKSEGSESDLSEICF